MRPAGPCWAESASRERTHLNARGGWARVPFVARRRAVHSSSPPSLARAAGFASLAVLLTAAPAAGQVQTVLSGLDGPVDFALLPDGSVWWLEYYSGNITRQDLATGEREVMFHVKPVVGGERGLVGLG